MSDLSKLTSNAKAMTRCNAFTSKKYGMIPTPEIVKYFGQRGYAVSSCRDVGTRTAAREGHAKHEVVFSGPDVNPILRPQLRVINASDGSTSLRVYYSMHVHACSNGLYIKKWEGETIKQRHYGPFNLDDVLAPLFAEDFVTDANRIVTRMRKKRMSADSIRRFVAYACGLRWNVRDIPFKLHDVWNANVPQEQQDHTLWNIFNRTQSSLVNGFEWIDPKTDALRSVAALKNFHRTAGVNLALWAKAESLVKA